MGPIFTQSHCTVFDHGLAANGCSRQKQYSYLSSRYPFTSRALLLQASFSRIQFAHVPYVPEYIGNGLLLALVGIVLVDHKRDRGKANHLYKLLGLKIKLQAE